MNISMHVVDVRYYDEGNYYMQFYIEFDWNSCKSRSHCSNVVLVDDRGIRDGDRKHGNRYRIPRKYPCVTGKC